MISPPRPVDRVSRRGKAEIVSGGGEREDVGMIGAGLHGCFRLFKRGSFSGLMNTGVFVIPGREEEGEGDGLTGSFARFPGIFGCF